MPSNIPKARKILRECLDNEQIGYDDLLVNIQLALNEMTRDFCGRRAPNKSVKCTPQLAELMRVTAYNNPEMTQQEIAIGFGVIGGRVSEAIRGLR